MKNRLEQYMNEGDPLYCEQMKGHPCGNNPTSDREKIRQSIANFLKSINGCNVAEIYSNICVMVAGMVSVNSIKGSERIMIKTIGMLMERNLDQMLQNPD